MRTAPGRDSRANPPLHPRIGLNCDVPALTTDANADNKHPRSRLLSSALSLTESRTSRTVDPVTSMSLITPESHQLTRAADDGQVT